ncbi:uncharacterized protein N7498_006576 [Penicillium cinerascens]|uniref:Uncharacterized protein n=1 Tax=Penicillium cinerascens TaxID=70096 RepID=A0A9W9MII0_9EURO|nr:uncharacterized protein N7498_006576 [Penicillium cinerascens]KAJ5201913.1 hypothetical protein N7498_006576 [Penicillium cinerascens]
MLLLGVEATSTGGSLGVNSERDPWEKRDELTGKDEMDVWDKWKLEADSRSFAGARSDNVNGADCAGHVP